MKFFWNFNNDAKLYNNNILYREYLRTIILLFVIPLIVLFVSIGIVLSINYTRTERYNNEQILSQVASDIDTKINSLVVSATKVYKNKQIVKLCKDNGILSKMEIQNILFTYGNEMYANLFYYDKESGNVHSSTTTVQVDRFLSQLYQFEGFDEISFKEFLKTEKIEFVPARMGGREYFLIAVPSRVEGVVGTDNCIFFVVDVQNFIRTDLDGLIYILNHNKQAISGHGLQKEILDAIQSRNGKLFLYNGLHRVSQFTCISSGLQLIMLEPIRLNCEQILMFLGMLLLMILIISFCTMSVKYMINLTYRPIAQMIKITEIQIDSSENELALIGKSVTDILKKNRVLSEQMRKMDKGEFAVLSLLSGKDDLKDVNILTDGNYYVAVATILRSSLKIRTQSVMHIIESIKFNFLEEGEYVVHFLNSIVLVMKENDERRNKIGIIKREFNKNSLLVSFGVGRTVCKKNDISKSYVEALSALEYRFIVGGDKIIYFEEMNLNKLNSIDDKKTLSNDVQQLKVFLRNGDVDRSTQIVEKVVSELQSGEMPLFIVRCICYEIVSALIDSINEAKKNIESGYEEYIETLSLMNIETVEQLIGIVQSFCHMYSESIAECAKNENATIKAVEEYIHKNISEYDLSVMKIAEELHFSSSYLSRVFKEKKGVSMSEYIKNYQIDVVKQMLIETDKTIAEIIEAIGHTNTSNFIRKFKRITGYTPGEYRKAFEKK